MVRASRRINGFLIATILSAAFVTSAAARPSADSGSGSLLIQDASQASSPASGAATLSSHVFTDTVTYGGTWWAPDSLRWEALRDSHWTFDSGVGSAFGPTGPNKPAGYHTLMEGWFGIDQTLNPLPYFRRSTTCSINGSWSFWAGVTLDEANTLCYAAGQGYGNGWGLELRKTFAYSGVGNASLSYAYAADVEPGFDYVYVAIDTTGTDSNFWQAVQLTSYSGASSGVETIPLIRGQSLRSTAGNVVIKFRVESDGSYSDEDGLHQTVCGAFAVDDISLTGALVDFSDFETDADGWAQEPILTGIGDFAHLVNRNTDLPPPATFCACGVRDSVLVFFDELGEHPWDQDNIAVSPWIDLKRGGDVGRPGRLMLFDVYAEMPLNQGVFLQMRARYYPYVCPETGLVTTSPFRDQNVVFYFGEAPFCNPPEISRLRDYSSVIGTGAEQVQIAFGEISLDVCWFYGCTGITNTTPWIDNVGLGIYGPLSAPNISMTTFDYLQDNFAADGTLNPASTGRLDTNTLKNASTPGPGSILRDTLVARGDGGNTEVRLVFRVRPGPFTSPSALLWHVAHWTAEPSLGAGWYSARMDTAEQNGVKGIPTAWMATYHESDPGFSGTDRTPDPMDPSQLQNEILPDHVFTPGSRIDYFIKARYLPPDPRNPAGTNWWVVPDTSGGRFLEVEILPSSMAADSSWNCTLYVDHHHDRNLEDQFLEEQGLTAALGAGGNNAEGTRFDRFDVQTPSSGHLSFGRPVQTRYGASIIQAFGYKNIAWHSATLSSLQLTDEDANVLGPWLTLRGVGGNRFWGSGSGLATSMHSVTEPSTLNFLRNTLGALRTCNAIRDANCPNTTALDSTFCIQTSAVAGSYFATTVATSVRGNGCPDLESFDLLDRNSAVATSSGQLQYVKNGVNRGFASITNHNTLDVDYKTVLDGMAVGRLRATPINSHLPALCTTTTAAVARADNVLDWFATAAICRLPAGLSDVPGGETPRPPQYRTALGNAYPNPMNPTTRIQFTNGVDGGRVALRIFDVTGRLVKTLVDAPLPAGTHEMVWDGTADGGGPVSNGMYFYRMSTNDYESSKKIVVMK